MLNIELLFCQSGSDTYARMWKKGIAAVAVVVLPLAQ